MCIDVTWLDGTECRFFNVDEGSMHEILDNCILFKYVDNPGESIVNLNQVRYVHFTKV